MSIQIPVTEDQVFMLLNTIDAHLEYLHVHGRHDYEREELAKALYDYQELWHVVHSAMNRHHNTNAEGRPRV